MKVYKIKISLKEVTIDPFRFLREWKNDIQLSLTKAKIRYHYKKLNWDKDFVWKKTMFCGDLNQACYRLTWELIQSYEGKRFLSECKFDGNRIIENYCAELIMKDFEKGKF